MTMAMTRIEIRMILTVEYLSIVSIAVVVVVDVARWLSSIQFAIEVILFEQLVIAASIIVVDVLLAAIPKQK